MLRARLGTGARAAHGGDADEGYAAWIAELKECLLQAGVHNRPAALMGDASLLSEATLRDVGALLTGGVDVRVGGLCLQEAGIYTHAEEEQARARSLVLTSRATSCECAALSAAADELLVRL